MKFYTKSSCGNYTNGDNRNTIFKNPQVRVLGRLKFSNNVVTQKKEMSVYRSAWQKMTSSRDHRYNQQTQARTKRKERVSSNRNQPCL